MPRVDPDDFDDRDLARIFIAPTLAEARLAEELLTFHEVKYTVVAEPLGRTIFGSPRNLAVFYVAPEGADAVAAILTRAGMGIGVVRD
jgi:hypothetical protein